MSNLLINSFFQLLYAIVPGFPGRVVGFRELETFLCELSFPKVFYEFGIRMVLFSMHDRKDLNILDTLGIVDFWFVGVEHVIEFVLCKENLTLSLEFDYRCFVDALGNLVLDVIFEFLYLLLTGVLKRGEFKSILSFMLFYLIL